MTDRPLGPPPWKVADVLKLLGEPDAQSIRFVYVDGEEKRVASVECLEPVRKEGKRE